MATQQTRPLAWFQCLGRNGWDSPLVVPDDMGTDVRNWMFTGGLGKKRDGSAPVALTGASSSGYRALFSFQPTGQDETLTELFIVSADTPAKILRVSSGNIKDNLTLLDPIESHPQQVTSVTHHGKLFLAYDSTVNRLHVYDPRNGNEVRRAGIGAPAAPTVADTGSGTYPATPRFYRVQFKLIDGFGTVLRQSNLSPVVPFTPSGTGAAARITRPAPPTVLLNSLAEPRQVQDITHWQVHASADDLAYYAVSGNIPIATTFYDDSVLPANYALGDLSPLEGANTPFPSVKFLGSDGLHLFGFGVWETTAGTSVAPVPGRVYFSPALESSETGDDERMSNTLTQQGWIDVAPNGSGVDRGLSGPLNNRMYVFQSRGIYMLVPTGDPVAPFARVIMTQAYGSVSHQSQVLGEDETGQPCLYFLDPRDGPRRITVGRTIDWLGKDVADIWATVNLDATDTVAWGLYHPDKKLVEWWVATGASNTPDTILTLDVTRVRAESAGLLRYGWSTWPGALAAASCGVPFSKTMNPVRSLRLVPYVGLTSGTLLRQDGTLQTDGGVPFQASITSKPLTGGTLARVKRIMESYLVAKAGPATITQTVRKNFGLATASSAKSLAAAGTEQRVRKFFDETDVADLLAVQITLGDGTALDQTFELDWWVGADELDSGAR